MRFRLLPLIFAMIFAGLPMSQAHATQVVGDNETASYIGTGGLLLGSSFSGTGTQKKEVASCLGCTWAYTVFCMYDGDGLCMHAVTGCAAGQIKYRVWFGRTSDTVEVIGSICWGLGTPPTRRDVESRLDDLVTNYVPPLDVATAPKGGTLLAIPIYGWTSQPSAFTPPAFSLGGRTVEITAIPKWRWNWGDGQVDWHGQPGSTYPNTEIGHQYRSAGDYELEVLTVWQASYSVAGIGTFEVSGDVLTQSKTVPIHVASTTTTLLKHK